MYIYIGKGFYTPTNESVSVSNDEALTYYVRGAKDAWLEENTASSWGDAVITKPVSVEAIHAWLKENPGTFIAAVEA